MVIVIVATFALVAIPRLGKASARERVRAAAHLLAAEIESVRARAKADSAGRRVVIILGSGSVTIAPANTFAVIEREIDFSAEPYTTRFARVDLGGDALIDFNAEGVPDSAGTVQLESAGWCVTVQIDGDTGRASVSAPAPAVAPPPPAVETAGAAEIAAAAPTPKKSGKSKP